MGLKGIFSAIDVSASGLSAQRRKLNVIASNIANAETTRTASGGPYRRRIVKFQETPGSEFVDVLRQVVGKLETTSPGHLPNPKFMQREQSAGGVEAQEATDPSPFRMVYDPTHPDADAKGYVAYPNVNVVTEMVDMISASRNYEANVSAIDAAKEMAKRALDI